LNKKHLSKGTSVRIRAMHGLYKTSFFDNMIGIIVGFDSKNKIYQVYVRGTILDLIEAEIIPIGG